MPEDCKYICFYANENNAKVVLKTTFGQSQRWSLIRGTLGVENEEKNNLNFANKVFNR